MTAISASFDEPLDAQIRVKYNIQCPEAIYM